MSTSNREERKGEFRRAATGNSADRGALFQHDRNRQGREENGESCAGVDTNEGADRRRLYDFSHNLSNDDDVVAKRGTKLGLIDVSQ